MKKYGDINTFESILYLLLISIKEKTEIYKKEHSYNNLYIIQNYLIFLMILTLNLQKYPEFIKAIFKGTLDFFHKLVDILMTLKKKKNF